jgi:hypothetical protein
MSLTRRSLLSGKCPCPSDCDPNLNVFRDTASHVERKDRTTTFSQPSNSQRAPLQSYFPPNLHVLFYVIRSRCSTTDELEPYSSVECPRCSNRQRATHFYSTRSMTTVKCVVWQSTVAHALNDDVWVTRTSGNWDRGR